MILVLMVCVLLIVFSILCPKSKFIATLDLIGHFLILGGYNGRYDISLYKIRYESEYVMPGTFEKIYDYLAIFFRRTGVSFEVFHLIITAICLVIIVMIISKVTDKIALVLGLMYGYSMIEYALQIQWFISSAIVISAIYYFYKNIYCCTKPRISSYVTYILLIIFAMGFHFAAIFFLILLGIKVIPINMYKKVCVCGPVVLYMFMNILLGFFLRYIPQLSEYVGQRRSIFVFVVMSVWVIIGLYLIEKNGSVFDIIAIENNQFVDFVRDTSWLMLFVIPFFSVSTIMDRVFHIWFIFYFCAISFYKSMRVVYIPQLLMLAYNWTSFVVFYVIFAKYSNGLMLLEEVINSNYFWGK